MLSYLIQGVPNRLEKLCSQKRKWRVLYPLLTYQQDIPFVGCFEKMERKEKKRKCNKNKIDFSSILFRCFMLRLILRLF
jgi:hypothetical protein